MNRVVEWLSEKWLAVSLALSSWSVPSAAVALKMMTDEERREPTVAAQLLTDSLRVYGGNGTIHRNEQLDVEVNAAGQVVAVWFRCQPLPFKQAFADGRRATDMRAMYGDPHAAPAIYSFTLRKDVHPT